MMLPECWWIEGEPCQLHYRHSAKKRIIVRPHPQGLTINTPKNIRKNFLKQWLNENKTDLIHLFSNSKTTAQRLPEKISYLGCEYPIVIDHSLSQIQWQQERIALPNWPIATQRHQLAETIYQRAQQHLPTILQQHAQQHQLHPTKVRLTRAKTFWGVCRKTSIALNWRLMMSNPYVIDYVCLHELCHLRHPNHSPNFWRLLQQYCPQMIESKQWLKQQGGTLFILD